MSILEFGSVLVDSWKGRIHNPELIQGNFPTLKKKYELNELPSSKVVLHINKWKNVTPEKREIQSNID